MGNATKLTRLHSGCVRKTTARGACRSRETQKTRKTEASRERVLFEKGAEDEAIEGKKKKVLSTTLQAFYLPERESLRSAEGRNGSQEKWRNSKMGSHTYNKRGTSTLSRRKEKTQRPSKKGILPGLCHGKWFDFLRKNLREKSALPLKNRMPGPTIDFSRGERKIPHQGPKSKFAGTIWKERRSPRHFVLEGKDIRKLRTKKMHNMVRNTKSKSQRSRSPRSGKATEKTVRKVRRRLKKDRSEKLA